MARASTCILGVVLAIAVFGESRAEGPLFSPEQFTFDRSKQSADLCVFNNETQPLVWTGRIVGWQVDEVGANHFSDTNDFRLEPGQIELAPWTSALLKIHAQQIRQDILERSYRIVLQLNEPLEQILFNRGHILLP
ncbi:hypothetical protein [Agrobacterium sp. NPDC089420]|uniref:hypothetical protein n=1 Tax=Agrobacterium sp. NPDC089420 TaxID=3363918 RepID=UPI0038516A06